MGTGCFKGKHEVGGFGSDVEASAKGIAFEGFFFGKAVFDEIQDRHLLGCPVDAQLTLRSKLEILDVR